MKANLLVSAAIVAFLLLWTPGYSVLALDHSGTLGTDETWSPADNPHKIVGTVTVPAGVKLTILPGTQIYFTGY